MFPRFLGRVSAFLSFCDSKQKMGKHKSPAKIDFCCTFTALRYTRGMASMLENLPVVSKRGSSRGGWAFRRFHGRNGCDVKS